MTIATIEPDVLVAGDLWEWKKTLDDYPAPTWVLTYRFRSRVGEFNKQASADGTDHSVSIAAATTAGYKAGLYEWFARVVNGSESYTVGSGLLTVRPDPAFIGAGHDPRSHARKVFEALEAAIEGRALSASQRDMVSYAIGSRSQSFDVNDSRAQLIQAYEKYKWLVYDEDVRERVAKGLPNPRHVGIRFQNP
jgi:hypothetical protein